MDVSMQIKKTALRTALGYIEKNPEENVLKLMDWVDKLAGDGPNSFPAQRKAFRNVLNDPECSMYQLIMSVFRDIDNDVLKVVFENFLLILICTLENFYRFICKGICRLESLSKWADRAIQWKQQVDALHIGAKDLLHTPNIILVGVGINAIKLMGLYSIPYLCMRAIGIDYFSLIQIQTLSALAHVISNALPNIAGMGSVEAAFLLLFSCYMDAADVSSVLVLYRLSTYFVPFLLSAFATERIGLRLYTKERSNTSMHTSNQEENHGIS